jgi:hypothetical protein
MSTPSRDRPPSSPEPATRYLRPRRKKPALRSASSDGNDNPPAFSLRALLNPLPAPPVVPVSVPSPVGLIVVGVPGLTTPPGLDVVVVPPVPVPLPPPVAPAAPVPPAAPLPSAPAAGAVTVRVIVLACVPDPELPVNPTSAAASTPSAIAPTAPSPTIGTFQFGAPASLVRAAAPHRRHHSCSPSSLSPHSGQTRSITGPATLPSLVAGPLAVAVALKGSSPTAG